ncbi:MAG: Fe-S cluster assembly protein SufD [Chthonomonadaceae bacterium]|nr:Fe-S cluster assembly protein SufD [Chthonomonadaceae bacterium]
MIKTQLADPSFAQTAHLSNVDEPGWLTSLRRAALSRFEEIGFPNRHHEEWRFTPINPILETKFTAAQAGQTLTSEAISLLPFAEVAPVRLVFVNGFYAPEHSTIEGLPSGVTVLRLSEAMNSQSPLMETHFGRYAKFEDQPFVALNTAGFTEGAFVHIPRNAVVETPIQLLFVTVGTETAQVAYPRTLIIAEENSQSTVVESYIGVGESNYLNCPVTEIVLGDNAVLDHYKPQTESESAFHIALMQIELQKTSNFASHNLALGGAIVRNEANANFHAEGAEATLNGMYFANGSMIVDNHTSIDHAFPHCDSHEVYKGILSDKARGVFNGKIFVRQDAQKTDAKQTNQTLLLSREATIYTKPQLEIFADDVRCTHGATVGQIDENSLFYLRSRGLSVEESTNLLIYAFAGDIVERIKVPALQNAVRRELFARLPGNLAPME